LRCLEGDIEVELVNTTEALKAIEIAELGNA
jgi:hypothetical protein